VQCNLDSAQDSAFTALIALLPGLPSSLRSRITDLLAAPPQRADSQRCRWWREYECLRGPLFHGYPNAAFL